MKGRELALKVKRSFGQYYEAACESTLAERPQDPRRVYFLRPSSFPYCGVRRFLDWPKVLEEKGKAHMDPGMLFWVTMGSAFHQVFQEILGKHGLLYGDWVCPKCKSMKRFSTYTRCKTCDLPRRYEELEVKYKKTLVGHVDGLYYDERTKTYWVIDYKSTSGMKIWIHEKREPVFPLKANIFQIKAYVPLLERQYGVKISGYMLVYLPRDNPFKTRVVCTKYMSRRTIEAQMTLLKSWVVTHRRMLQAKNMEDFSFLYANKLCKSHGDYRDNYESKYNPCPHEHYCFDPERINKVAAKTIATTTYPVINYAPSSIRRELDLE